MSHSAVNARPRFTWADYQHWPDDERWEIVGGEAYAMSPSPTVRHQHIVRELAGPLIAHFKGKQCRPFISLMDVKLSDEDIVQPDLLVVCDPAQIRRTHIEGPPALVVEILSPGTRKIDEVTKRKLYERFGVTEYWIADPELQTIKVYRRADGAFVRAAELSAETGDTLTTPLLPDFSVALGDVFASPI